MDLIYYYNEKLRLCPVKKFLEKYSFKTRAYIDARIQYVKEHNGIPQPPISKRLHSYNFFEVRIKQSQILYRIYYFCHQNNIVLLNALEKPSHYEKGMKKKIDKAIHQSLELAKQYHENFITRPQSYEKYQ